MGGYFRRARRGQTDRVVATFSADERELLRALAGQLAAMVAPEPQPEGGDPDDPLAQMVGLEGLDGLDSGPAARRPDDPGLARLLPDAYRDDDQAASEFRRFTERQLREGKQDDASTVLATLARADADEPQRPAQVRLDPEQAQAWLRHLNDLRLVLGEQLGLGTADDPEQLLEGLTPDDPRFGVGVVYDWLTAVQGTLVDAVWAGEG